MEFQEAHEALKNRNQSLQINFFSAYLPTEKVSPWSEENQAKCIPRTNMKTDLKQLWLLFCNDLLFVSRRNCPWKKYIHAAIIYILRVAIHKILWLTIKVRFTEITLERKGNRWIFRCYIRDDIESKPSVFWDWKTPAANAFYNFKYALRLI